MESLTLEGFHAALEAQGVPKQHFAVRCPACNTVQSLADLETALAVADRKALGRYFHDGEADPRRAFGFSCVGRYACGEKPPRGCDWTLGGFLKIHRLVIKFPDGQEFPAFEPATPEEARDRMNAGTMGAG